MEPGALQWLGWWYASRLYIHLKSTDTLTFHAWSVFRKAYPEEVDHHVTFRVQERDLASMQYLSVVDRLSKLDVSMLTFLCVRTLNLSIDHLIALTKIQNLAVLVLENGTNSWQNTMQKPTIDMIRDWGRSVGESGSFTKLRALVLSGYDISHINSVLKSISSFPALNLFGVDGLFIQSGVDCWGDWTNHLPKCTKFSKLSPETIWETNTTTTASKMRQLYQFSLEISQSEAAQMAAGRSISLLYLQTRESVPRCHTEWFHRELQDGSDTKTKRAQDEEHRDRRETYGKKRKIRDRNKVGMESLLGSFM
ncbi:hypothetical protein COCMIDRAFT_34116 [Bipolaris oryzae ATCC 44560]|uniref:Uncharacterized protein n=1 Tax=Bipolaris oryzae ATCC 44560 TaxID=930090 RepID=W6ZEX8_COCMI|nr:uncharacterized protein COCMIDRAFT_34116 [Bipolaris oryzae ATCC 44560]EUC48433.1 hypothetical protein COCMIDRAFT_34116 [Bipolaris oryzae ATCC 44560]